MGNFLFYPLVGRQPEAQPRGELRPHLFDQNSILKGQVNG